jgi:hypothetical protein
MLRYLPEEFALVNRKRKEGKVRQAKIAEFLYRGFLQLISMIMLMTAPLATCSRTKAKT